MENIFENCEVNLSPDCKIPIRALDDILRNINLIHKRYDSTNNQVAFNYILTKIWENADEKSIRLWNDFKKEEIALSERKNARIRHLNEKRLKKINEILK